jgi:very-long-chain ceramide synthase
MAESNVKTEPFPAVSPHAHMSRKSSSQTVTRRRRKSSSLGGDPRGDTGAGAIATNLPATLESSTPASPTSQRFADNKQPRERKRKKALKLFRRWKRMSRRHTWVNPLILIVVLVAAYYISPGEHNPLHPALFLSYANPPLAERTNLPAHIGNVTQYGKGPLDFAFFGFYVIVFTFTREFLMQRLIKPIGVRCGIRPVKMSRFMEQFYTAIYFLFFGPFGLWVMYRSPVWYFNTAGMYEGFPHRAHESYFKAYYLLQAAYWAQQAVVLMLQLEKPRKDFRELVLHHIVTLALIGLSYRFHFTYMGVAVYVTHDISDFFLAVSAASSRILDRFLTTSQTSKVLNYLDHWFTIPYFAGFLCIWAYTRHYLNLVILKSLLPPGELNIPYTSLTLKTGEFTTVGPYKLDWDTQQYKCWISQPIVFFLLAALQAINMFWFFLICRILARYFMTGEEKDERSDDEDEAEEQRMMAADEKKALVEQKQKMNGHAKESKVEKPTLAVNGKPVSPTE